MEEAKMVLVSDMERAMQDAIRGVQIQAGTIYIYLYGHTCAIVAYATLMWAEFGHCHFSSVILKCSYHWKQALQNGSVCGIQSFDCGANCSATFAQFNVSFRSMLYIVVNKLR